MNDAKTENEKNCQKALSCWFLTGATASGKTEIGMEMARRLGAEILSLDSMAIYRGMDIGTAKPSAAQRDEIPHHLIDIIDPNESFSVSQYRENALQAIDDVQSRGKQVLFIGGTALYLKALLRGLFDGPPADWEFRESIEKELDSAGLDALFRRLEQVDPLSAHKLHSNDKRRIVRALEVYKLTGEPISHWQNEFETARSAEECKVFAVQHPRAVLHQRIETRVKHMFEHGLVDEVQKLLTEYQSLSHTAAQAVGYREVFEFLSGRGTIEETAEQVLVRTRRFARHQETWFRGLAECRLVPFPETAEVDRLAAEIIETGQRVSLESGQ